MNLHTFLGFKYLGNLETWILRIMVSRLSCDPSIFISEDIGSSDLGLLDLHKS